MQRWQIGKETPEGLFMIDEINYFPKRDRFQKKKKLGDDWNELKKTRERQESRKKQEKKQPSSPPDSPQDK